MSTTPTEVNGTAGESLFELLQPQAPRSGSRFSDDTLFVADGKPVRAWRATRENVLRAINFIRNFPLSTSWDMTDEEILEYLFSPHNVFMETDNALVTFHDVEIGKSASLGFVFWDRKVTGNEKMMRDIFKMAIAMFRLHRLTCWTQEKNRSMWRMLERIGFRREGCLREAFLLPDGKWNNLLAYGLLASDFDEAPPAENK